MLRIAMLSAVLVFASAAAHAESFTGKLLDASCSCAPTASTTSFALQVSGKTMTFDSEGNKKAAEALKASNSSAERAKEPNAANNQVTAKVEGTASGEQIKVESIEVQ